jgi:hypothetical protein
VAEYIEREAVKKVFYDFGKTLVMAPGFAARQIDAIPAADVAPVVHAEWVVCGDGENLPWMCSHCGKTTAHKYKTMYGKYCHNCGARMDGE